MLKTLRVAGFAAIALLCSANGAAASDLNDAAPAAAAAPVASVAATPIANASTPATAETVFGAGRVRPDRQDVPALLASPEPTPAVGITGTAGIAPTRRNLSDLVAEHAGAEVTDEEFRCLASAVYFESRGEPLEGQLAVAEVILNRVRSGRFRDTVCNVVKQPSQFSFVRGGVIPAPRNDASWARATAIAHIAINNLADATGDDSLFFHATYVNPRWGRPRIARIGNHIFYR